MASQVIVKSIVNVYLLDVGFEEVFLSAMKLEVVSQFYGDFIFSDQT